MNLTKRSFQKELLDADNIPQQDLYKNLEELNVINTLLGGHNITVKGFKELIETGKKVHIAEVGCGGGDNLKAIYNWAIKNKIEIQLTGIDLKDDCINYARQSLKEIQNTNYIVSDYKLVNFGENKPDIIFSSLFCHHLNDKQIKEYLNWSINNSRIGFFINDLHRNSIAYLSIKILTKIFSSSYLVKNDASLSVARGFKKKEWQSLLMQTGIYTAKVEWKWAFRHLIVFKHAK